MSSAANARMVLVTGSNGHLGYNLVCELRSRGYRVRAGVRDPRDTKKTAPLVAAGAEPVAADLLNRDTLMSAAAGVEGIFHVAAVVQMWARDPEMEIIRPTVEGMRNVLEAAASTKVRRVVVTSSMAAVGAHGSEEAPLTEADWNEEPATPYAIAKTNAERLAWRIAEREGLDIVTVLPSTIIGPGFHRHTPITTFFDLVLNGWLPFALPAEASYVDARDLAVAQIAAYETESAHGRYIASGPCYSLRDLVGLIAQAAPGVKVPRLVLPIRLLPPLIAADWLANKVLKTPRQLTSEVLEEFAGKRMVCSATRAERELGWQARPTIESVADTVEWLRFGFPR
jgi:dihydroflavonol-4-reductase